MPDLPNVNSYQSPQPQRAAPQAYAPQAPQARAPRYTQPQTQQRFQQPQATLRSYEGNGNSRSASDAARAAAQNPSQSRSSVMGAPNAEQKSVLDRIAQSIGPQAAGQPQNRQPAMRGAYPPAQNGQRAAQGYPQQGYQQPGYPQQNYQGQQTQQPSAPQRRGAARRRG